VLSGQGEEQRTLAHHKVTSGIDEFREAAVHCPLPAAVELIGEKWAFLIVRGAFNGLCHFEEFQAGLGVARNILADRLAKLVAGGIMERRHDSHDRRKVIYSLTPKGEALLPVLVSLRQWGEEWGHGPAPIILADAADQRPIRKISVQAADGRALSREELMWISRELPEQSPKGSAA
jgi:DNA-binding HxlR family transcriptional regulator